MKIAIISGGDFDKITGVNLVDEIFQDTPWGETSSSIKILKIKNIEIFFLSRHGDPQRIPPHKINYKANIWALHAIGVKEIIATNAIGGINSEVCPGSFVLPDQLIDYSYGRHSTFYDEDLKHVTHIDFSVPFTEELRQTLKRSFHFSNGNSTKKRTLMNGGVYGCTRGTAARDGRGYCCRAHGSNEEMKDLFADVHPIREQVLLRAAADSDDIRT